jgi:hypothetical protein
METQNDMAYCDHCQGQRFDRAQVLRALRATRMRLRTTSKSHRTDQVLAQVIEAVRALEIPHLELVDDALDGEVVH